MATCLSPIHKNPVPVKMTVCFEMPSVMNAYYPVGGKLGIVVGIQKTERFDLCVSFVKHESVTMCLIGLTALSQENGQLLMFLREEIEHVNISIPSVDILLVTTKPRKIVLRSKRTYTTVTLKLNQLLKVISLKNCLNLYIEDIAKKVLMCDVFYEHLVSSTVNQLKSCDSEIASILQLEGAPDIDEYSIKSVLSQHISSEERVLSEIVVTLENALIQDIVKRYKKNVPRQENQMGISHFTSSKQC